MGSTATMKAPPATRKVAEYTAYKRMPLVLEQLITPATTKQTARKDHMSVQDLAITDFFSLLPCYRSMCCLHDFYSTLHSERALFWNQHRKPIFAQICRALSFGIGDASLHVQARKQPTTGQQLIWHLMPPRSAYASIQPLD